MILTHLLKETQKDKKTFLPDGHPDKIHNLTGINDPFEIPGNIHLIINTNTETEEESIQKLYDFIIREITNDQSNPDE